MNKQEILKDVKNMSGLCSSICRYIWEHPEVGKTEKQSADFYRNLLKQEGFTIVNSTKLEHAFYAQAGHGSPVIAVLGEYDALPGLSQKTVTEKCPVEEGAPGHGCGHNLLGAAAAVGAVALKHFLEASGCDGTVRFYGCPEEELLDGKVIMIAEGMFSGVDLAISWHPSDSSMVHDRGYLANTSMKFYFTGKTSHAAFAPELGRSALDAVELMNVGVNYLREHVIDRTRIHYTTDSGGFAPNIVPDKASSWYFVRAPHMADVRETAARVERVAQGAAIMTDTKVRVEHGYGCCEFKENNAFADLAYENLTKAPQPEYTEEELKFARELEQSVPQNIIEKNRKIFQMPEAVMFTGTAPRELWKACEMNPSSDTGDVSYVIPTCLFTTACWPIGCSPHTWQATASAGMSLGEKGAFYAAEVIAGIGYDLYTRPEIRDLIIKEFRDRDDGSYQPMLADTGEICLF